MPAVVAGVAMMAVSFALGSPLWFAGCLMVGLGVGFLSALKKR